MEVLWKLGAVCAGGALGALLRYLINLSPLNPGDGSFPFHTFTANIVGSFLIGFLLILADLKWGMGEHMRLFAFVGVLGAFTTFSTFELDIWNLIEAQKYFLSLAYLVMSVVLGFVALVAGIKLAGAFIAVGN